MQPGIPLARTLHLDRCTRPVSRIQSGDSLPGFNNDTTPRFDAKAAALAWQRTLAFFAQNLKTA